MVVSMVLATPYILSIVLLAVVGLWVPMAHASIDRPIIGVLTTPLDGGPCETLTGDTSRHIMEARSMGGSAYVTEHD